MSYFAKSTERNYEKTDICFAVGNNANCIGFVSKSRKA